MNEIILGLGANVGEPAAQLSAAVAMLGREVEVVKVSGVYRSEPVGFLDQPDFFNLVVLARSASPPEMLLAGAVEIERALGRARSFPNAPRTIDIDLLDWSGPPIDAPGLTIPHPRMHLRAFVLAPLNEVAPTWRHPLLGATAAELMSILESPGRIERVGELEHSR
jgi:2-amino-4-hydroxy-6-hydroxymethyldihydropteridine diphosphokinase